MKIPSKDVIQADTLERVTKAVEAVAGGARTDHDIAAAIGDLVDRQGRYYRLAGENLRFLQRETANSSTLAPLGEEYAKAPEHVKAELLVRAILGNPVFQRLVPFLEAKGPAGASREDLEVFLGQVAELGTAGMAQRRVSSYIQWLRKLDLLESRGDHFVLKTLPAAVPLIRYASDQEPMFPNRFELREYEEQARRVASRRASIQFYVDQAARERAATSHETLIKLMAERLRRHGAVPKANRYIDLSARVQGTDFLFEMKSTTQENPHVQIRRGLSQLYEYRYIQNIEAPRLVLVIENALPRNLEWLKDYLIRDRGILLVWDGRGRFLCPPEIADKLPFLN